MKKSGYGLRFFISDHIGMTEEWNGYCNDNPITSTEELCTGYKYGPGASDTTGPGYGEVASKASVLFSMDSILARAPTRS